MPASLLEGSLLADEIALELMTLDEGVDRYRRAVAKAEQRGDAGSLKPVERLMAHWFEVYSTAVRDEQKAITRNEQGPRRAFYGPYLLQLPADKVAVIVMHEVMGAIFASSAPNGEKVTAVALSIARALNAEVNIRSVRANEDAWYELVHTDRTKLLPKHINRVAVKHIDEGARWPRVAQLHVGAFLLDLLLNTASAAPYAEKFEPAFMTALAWAGGRSPKKCRWIRLTREAARIVEDGHSFRQYLRPKYAPMLVPPLEWSETERGGYYRLYVAPIKRMLPKHVDKFSMSECPFVAKGLNAINRTPWRVNTKILGVVQELYRAGGGMVGLPPADNIPLPPIPDDFESDKAVAKKWKKEAAVIYRRNKGLLSDRVNFLYTVQRAEEMKETPEFFFPHQLDFRGRAYPLPLYLNHQGDDLRRGLLTFAHGKKVDRNDEALLIHAANCCGVDKLSYAERVQWTQDNRETLEGWAADPLENTGWMKVGSPWQALAAAIALNDDEAAARIPVQSDGTCNGLQHYAAMARDENLASLVNVMPGEKPADVYRAVAEAVKKLLAVEAVKDQRAERLLPQITRNLVKQPVMTKVYGVSATGAREQIIGVLEDERATDDIEDQEERKTANRQVWDDAKYLADIVLKAVASIAPSAEALMAWLRQCARKIVKETGDVVRWTTPLGLRVEQAYRSVRSIIVSTAVGGLRLAINDDKGEPKLRRQEDGFPPNFVHSIDSSHLFQTAIACEKAGVMFAAVHDSYWTHAADQKLLAQHLREQFVSLHSRQIISELWQQMKSEYPAVKFDPPPASGSLDISVASQSSYLFC